MFKKMLLVAGLAMMSNVAFALPTPVTIDDFSVPMPLIQALGGDNATSLQTPPGAGAADANILGGFREVIIQNGPSGGRSEVEIGDDVLFRTGLNDVLGVGTTAPGAVLTVIWDGVAVSTADPTGGAGVDLAGVNESGLGSRDLLQIDGADRNEGILFEVLEIDNDGVDVTFDIWTEGGTNLFSLTQQFATNGSQFFFFDDFVSAAGSAVGGGFAPTEPSLLAASAIRMTIAGVTNTPWDGLFSLVESSPPVPVPAPMALLAIGLVGLGFTRRRRNSAPN